MEKKTFIRYRLAAVAALTILRPDTWMVAAAAARSSRSPTGVCSGKAAPSASTVLDTNGVSVGRVPITVSWLVDSDELPDRVSIERDTTRKPARQGPPIGQPGVSQTSPVDGSFTPDDYWRDGSLIWVVLPTTATAVGPGIRVTVQFGAGGLVRFRVPLPVDGTPIRVVSATTTKRGTIRLATGFSNGEAGWLNVLAATTTFHGCRVKVGPVAYAGRF